MTKYEVVRSDADLDSEFVLLPNGERLTNQVADEIADDLPGRGGLGRPSLTSVGSCWVTLAPSVVSRAR